MKTKRIYIYGLIVISVVALYFIDRNVWMKQRVMRHALWEHDGEERIRGDFINTNDLIYFKKNIMVFDRLNRDNDTLILKWQYFNTMKILDPKTHKIGKYRMKGANWINFQPPLNWMRKWYAYKESRKNVAIPAGISITKDMLIFDHENDCIDSLKFGNTTWTHLAPQIIEYWLEYNYKNNIGGTINVTVTNDSIIFDCKNNLTIDVLKLK